MRYLLAVFLSALLWCSLVFANPMTLGGVGNSTTSCSQATTFLGRTSGLSGAESTAITALICGLVTDGIITGTLSGAAGCGSILDALYIMVTNTTTTANLNICGTGLGLTQSGTVTFTADAGYTGDGSTGALNTGFDPGVSGPGGYNYTLNSATIGAYILNNRTTTNVGVAIGAFTGSGAVYIQPYSGHFGADLNGQTDPTFTNTSSQGDWMTTRNSSTSIDVYKNGSTAGFGNIADASKVIPTTIPFVLLALSSVGDYSPDTIGAAYMGAGMTAPQAAAIDARINTYMRVFGVNVH